MEEKNNQILESKNDALKRGVAFQEMVRGDGWKFIKLYFENKLKALATQLLIEDKPITEYEKIRMELVGIRKLFGFVDNDIKTLEDESKKNTRPAK